MSKTRLSAFDPIRFDYFFRRLTGNGDQVLRRLVAGSAGAFAIKIGGVGLLFFMHVMVARTLGAEQFGIFTYARDVSQLLAVALAIGLPTTLMRYVAQYHKQNQFGLMRGIAKRGQQMVLASVVLGAALVFSLGFSGYLESGLSESLICAGFLLPLLALIRFYQNGLRGFNSVLLSQLPQKVLLPGTVIVCLLLLPIADLFEFLQYYLSIFFVLCLGSGLVFWRRISDCPPSPPQFEMRLWLTAALPILIGAASEIALKRIDVFLLGTMTDMATVGIYAAATRIATLNVIMIQALSILSAPMLSTAYHSREYGRARRIMLLTILLSTTAALPATTVMLLWPRTILELLGAEYGQGSTLLQILALGQLVVGVTGSSGIALAMVGKEKLYAILLLSLAAFNALGNYLVIPIYGPTGAAVFTSVSLALLGSSQLFVCLKVLRFGAAMKRAGERLWN